MKIKAFTMNSFAKAAKGGNPAAVVLNADYLSEYEMKKIAKVIGFSETAFVLNSECGDFKVRFFTPVEEVDLCGHATIAAFFTLANKGIIKPGYYTQETKAGILSVEIKNDFSVLMNQNTPEFYNIIEKKEIASSLNIAVDDIMEDLPVQVVSTGLKDIIVPIKSIVTLNKLMPDLKQIEEISRENDVTGYHVFTLDTTYNSTAHCRNFAPLYGIPEESATGTSSGALSCYLYKYNKLNHNEINNIILEQGYFMGRPSEILASLLVDGEDIKEIKVGGKVLDFSEMEVEIN